VDISSLLGVVAVFALVAANGFFVAGEFALVKVRATRIEQLVSEGVGAAKVVQSQIQHLDTYIASTQLGITLASLALGWIGEPSLSHLIEPLFDWIGGGAAQTLSHSLAIVISFVLITGFHIVLGELVPKSIALQSSEKTSLFVARPLLLFTRLLHPFILLMNSVGNAVVRLFGMEATSEHASVHSVEELEMLVAQSRQGGVLDAQEEAFLHHVFIFGETSVQAVMLPRSEVVGVPNTISLEELKQTFAQEQYTRLPVYEENLDSIIGMVHLKDVFSWLQSEKKQPFSLPEILRPVLYVTQTSSIEAVFAQMRSKRIHLAIVIDEYGGTAGMVTLEDIVEEIVGEVQDEFDTRERGVRQEVEVLPDGSSSVDGLMSLSSFSEQFNIDTRKYHSRTVGGFVFEKLGRIARHGDTVSTQEYLLRVEEMDGRRIARVRVEKKQDTSSESE
jgi:putative hemolysin